VREAVCDHSIAFNQLLVLQRICLENPRTRRAALYTIAPCRNDAVSRAARAEKKTRRKQEERGGGLANLPPALRCRSAGEYRWLAVPEEEAEVEGLRQCARTGSNCAALQEIRANLHATLRACAERTREREK
jgi:hypothetical protein